MKRPFRPLSTLAGVNTSPPTGRRSDVDGSRDPCRWLGPIPPLVTRGPPSTSAGGAAPERKAHVGHARCERHSVRVPRARRPAPGTALPPAATLSDPRPADPARCAGRHPVRRHGSDLDDRRARLRGRRRPPARIAGDDRRGGGAGGPGGARRRPGPGPRRRRADGGAPGWHGARAGAQLRRGHRAPGRCPGRGGPGVPRARPGAPRGHRGTGPGRARDTGSARVRGDQ